MNLTNQLKCNNLKLNTTESKHDIRKYSFCVRAGLQFEHIK